MSSSTAANASHLESLPSEKGNPFAVLGVRARQLETLTREALQQHYKGPVKHLDEKGPQQLPHPEWDRRSHEIGDWPKSISNVVHSPARSDLASGIKHQQDWIKTIKGDHGWRILEARLDGRPQRAEAVSFQLRQRSAAWGDKAGI